LAVAMGGYFGVGLWYQGLMGIFAILGHNFSVFLKFRGGKGVATSLGVLIIYSPTPALLTIAIWLIVAIFTRYSSLGAVISFALLPLNIYLFDFQNREKLLIAAFISVFIIIRHGDNIMRLLKGAERKIGQRA